MAWCCISDEISILCYFILFVCFYVNFRELYNKVNLFLLPIRNLENLGIFKFFGKLFSQPFQASAHSHDVNLVGPDGKTRPDMVDTFPVYCYNRRVRI